MSALKVRLEVAGLGAEKLLNAARAAGIRLYGVRRRRDRTLSVTCAAADGRRLRDMALERGFSATAPRPVGALLWGWRLRGRVGLAAGALVFGALTVYAMGFVWRIDIQGAGAYAGEVRAFLAQIHVQPGIRRNAVDLAQLREDLEWRLPRVKWVQTAFSGVTLRVRLIEGTTAETENETPGDVVAAADGVLTRLTTLAGTPVCRAGEAVRRGQVLIRGEERGKDGAPVPVKARGEAIARRFVTAQAAVSLTEYLTVPTGRETVCWRIATPLGVFRLGDTPDYLQWDLDVQEYRVGGAWIPVVLTRESYREAAIETGVRGEDAAREEAAEAALFRLRQALFRKDVIDKNVEIRMIEGDYILALAYAEISEDIARFQQSNR